MGENRIFLSTETLWNKKKYLVNQVGKSES